MRVKPGEHDAVEGIECFDKVIDIDQSPIGRTPRSNPATYTDLFTHDPRALLADARGEGARLQAGPLLVQRPRRPLRDVQGRRADQDRDALPAGRLRAVRDLRRASATTARRSRCASRASRSPTCSRCRSRRRSQFFAKIPKIRRRLQTLHDVGLDYIKLGQPATTLSGGEAQRVKLAKELVARSRPGGRSTSSTSRRPGLHFADIEKLLEVLQRLVDAGNTVLVIEHNLDVIKQADWIVDLGPEGGEAGGEVIATGHARAGRRGRRLATPGSSCASCCRRAAAASRRRAAPDQLVAAPRSVGARRDRTLRLAGCSERSVSSSVSAATRGSAGADDARAPSSRARWWLRRRVAQPPRRGVRRAARRLDEAAGARQEPSLLVVLLAGIAGDPATLARTARSLDDRGARRARRSP